ncbi:tRNA pseudouridine synthase B [Oenococcus oeni]|uniref:tRNA pseudouridine(55) synthase TruB n=1 Tax=Oenococcus oeni TaxID=1247 RepID=UPI0010B1B69B|nr:tRNA pseudouridine(55) synthase TruB [Oenococcus oeni]SYW05050.1 tRNA pseudouridine synthase B [Oenococcus oeni]
MYNGIVLVDKPAGLTSFDVVAKLRKIFQQKQVGHTGTLDPSVTGLLVIVLGKATKLIDYLQENQKQYRGTLILGLKTDTQDMDGQVTEMQFLKEAIADFKKKAAFDSFLGSSDQLPPMYSAVKVGGKHLYELARKGETIERKSRKIKVTEFQQVGGSKFDASKGQEYINFVATVSKGTYIRTLIEDFGAKLGLPATMMKLRRIEADGYDVKNSINLEEILASKTPRKFIIPMEKLLPTLPKYSVGSDDWQLIKNGGWLKELPISVSPVKIFYNNSFQAIYEKQDGFYKPKKMLIHEDH